MPLLSLLLLLPIVEAAELTDLAPAMRGDIAVRYDWDAERARLQESGETVGKRVIAAHTVTWSGSFSFIDGAAAFFEIPHIAAEKVRYPEANAMIFDPTADAGTMLNTSKLADPPEIRGTGVGGMWIGLRGTPVSEQLFGKRGDRTTWMLETAVRFKDKTNLWTYGPRGTRGAGPGAPAVRLATTISTTKGDASPYVDVRWERSGRITTDLVDENENVLATGVELRPASTVGLSVGTDLLLEEYGTDGAQVAMDFRGTFAYRTWQDIPSGIYLPDILDASTGLVANESETASVMFLTGVNWRIHEYVQLNISGEVGTGTPRRAENFYPVSTGMGNVLWGLTTDLTFRLRDPMFDRLTPATNTPATALPSTTPPPTTTPPGAPTPPVGG
jgi:hypothetical protein